MRSPTLPVRPLLALRSWGALIKSSVEESRFLDFGELPVNGQFRFARNDKH